MQWHAQPCNTMQYHAIPCNTMQYHAIQCNTMQYNAIPCNTMQYHAIPCNTMQYYAIPCNTMQEWQEWGRIERKPPNKHCCVLQHFLQDWGEHKDNHTFAWLRFWKWSLIKICVWTCDMNSTLARVRCAFGNVFSQLWQILVFEPTNEKPAVIFFLKRMLATKWGWCKEHGRQQVNTRGP